jgi:hypothetical protein
MSATKSGFFAFVQLADQTCEMIYNAQRSAFVATVQALPADSKVIAIIEGTEKPLMENHASVAPPQASEK